MNVLMTLLVAIVPLPAPDGWEDLVSRVPRSANALAVLDGEALRASPLLRPEGAVNVEDTGTLLFNIPKTCRRLVLATELDFRELVDTERVALLELDGEPTLAAIAQKEGGEIDHVGGREAVRLPRDFLITKLAPNTFAAMYPARRQSFARWLGSIDRQGAGRGDVSPYLRAAAGRLDANAPIVIALDLADVAALGETRSALRRSRALAAAPVKPDVDAIASLLTSVEGLVLTVSVGEGLHGELRVDFGAATAVLGPLAKPLLLEVLADSGAYLADFDDWQAVARGRSITLSGALSRDGVRQALGLFELPTTAVSPGRAPIGEPPNAALAASKRYFDGVVAVRDEWNRMRGVLRGRTNASQALWYDRFAEKVDQLPALNVDPNLLTFGAEVAKRYRAIAYSFRGVNISTNFRRTGFEVTASDFEQIRRQESAVAQDNFLVLTKEIDTLTAETRKAMTQKFQVEF